MIGDLTTPAQTVGEVAEGSLVAWGDWGYAFVVPSTSASTQIRDRELALTSEVVGIPVGETRDGRLLFSHGRGYPGSGLSGPSTFLVDPSSGDVQPIPGVADNEVVLGMSASPSGDILALHIVPPSRIIEGPFLGSTIRLLSESGDTISEVPVNRAIEPMAWSSDGRYVTFPRSDLRGRYELVFLDTTTETTLRFHSDLPGRRPQFPVALAALPPG
jgi:hypothetical protein